MIDLFTTIISVIAGFLIAIFTDPIRKRLDRTTLKISFDNSKDLLTTPDDTHEFGTYVKVRLENCGRDKYARNLRCYLTSIEKLNPSGEIWETIFDTPLPMIWAYKETIESIDLPPKMWAYFNIVSFNKGENKILPATHRKPFLWRKSLADIGTYRFNIYVTGENILRPIRGSIELVWRGNWDDFSMENFHQVS
jgi:hypothetical protein